MLTKVNMLHIMATETQNVIRESEVRCGEHHKRYKGKCNEGRKKETYLINSLLSGIRHGFNCCDHCTNVTTEIIREMIETTKANVAITLE